MSGIYCNQVAMKKYLYFLAPLVSIYMLSCTEVNNQPAKATYIPTKWFANPNGDSELALLMRAMYDDGQRMKVAIKNGEPFQPKVDFEKILTASATEPEKAASAEYHAFAQTYIQTMKAMQDAEPAKAIALYDTMVANCMTCHQALCPGPTVRIKKLKL